MTTFFVRLFCALGVALAMVCWSSDARADRTENAVDIGVTPWFDIQVAPLHAPSSAHPWGTIALAWHATEEALVDHLRVGEWDLREGRFVKVRTIRDGAWNDRGLRLARSGSTLIVITSGLLSPGGATELIQLGLDLDEQGSVTFADGSFASLAIDPRFIAVGSYLSGTDNYEVRLLDAATLAIVTTTTFQGPFTPWPVQEISSHALRFETNRLYIALAEPDPRFVRLTLPSLAIDASAVFRVPQSHRWAYTSAALSSPPSPLSFDSGNDRHLLSSDLRIGALLPSRTPPKEDELSAEMIGERVTQRIFGRTVSTLIRHGRWHLRVSP